MGERREVRLPVAAGQYLRVVAEPLGIEVEISLRGPDGTEVATGGPVSRRGSRVLSVVTPRAGEHRLVVAAGAGASVPGRFRLSIEAQREALPADSARVAAQEAFAAGLRERAKSTGEANQAALARLEEALRLWSEAGDREGMVDALNEIGTSQRLLGDSQRAYERLSAGLAIARENGYRRAQVEALNALGIAASDLGRRDEAEKLYHEAIEIAGQLGEPGLAAESYLDLGYFSYYYLRRLQPASEALAAALPLYRAAFDPAGEAKAQAVLGLVAQDQGDLDRALAQFKEALALSATAGDRLTAAATRSNIAGIYMSQGKLQQALVSYTAALEGGAEGDREQQAKIVHNLASLYFALGKLDLALEWYKRAIQLQPGVTAAFTLNSIGTLYQEKGEPAAARDNFEQALAIGRKAENPDLVALTLHNLGRLDLAQNDAAKARAELEQALALRRDPPGRVRTLLELGTAHARLGQPQLAAARFEEALALARRAELRALIGLCLERQATLDRDRGDLDTARRKIEEALQVVEAVRSTVSSDDLRTSFLAANRNPYELYLDLLMRLAALHPDAEHWAAALKASEQARARGLLDLLAQGRIEVDAGVDPALRQREVAQRLELTKALAGLRYLQAAAHRDEAAIERVSAALLDAERRHQTAEEALQQSNPRRAEVLDARQIEALLEDDTVLLEYAVGREGVFLFAVTHDGLAVFALGLSPEELKRRVLRLRQAVESPERKALGIYLAEGAELYRLLVWPAREVLVGKKHLLISPDGVLHRLPFEALLTEVPAPGQPLSDLPFLLNRYAVSYIPSATVLASLREPRPPRAPLPPNGGKELVAFANPIYRSIEGGAAALAPLPDSEREVEAIAGLYRPEERQLYLGGAASRDHVDGNPLLEHARRIHFATHGFLDELRPELSGLALSPSGRAQDDGFLRVREIFGLRLSADLVVLSACESGGTPVRGEGLVGLSRAFFYAGAARLVVSLWRAAESSAADLMVAFYRRLADSAATAEALRAAKREIIAGGRHAHPFYWAPFVLVGEPR